MKMPTLHLLGASLLSALALSAPTTALATTTYRVNIDVGADTIPARNLWAAGDTPQYLHAEMAGIGNTSYANGASVADHGGTVRAAAFLDDIGVLNQSLSVMSDLTYTFQLLAQPWQAPDAHVPVTVAALATHGVPGSFSSGEAKFTLQQSGQQGYLIYQQAYTYRSSPAFTMFSVNQVVDLVPGAVYTVYLYAQTHAYNTTAAEGTVTVTADEVVVDPVFTIDPRYASDYYFSGIPTAPVPEPGTASLMALGATALGLVRRRRSVTRPGPASRSRRPPPPPAATAA